MSFCGDDGFRGGAPAIDGSPSAITFKSYDSLRMYVNMTWSQSASVSVAPGTYDVAMQCSTGMSNSGGRVFYADINALAVPK